MIGAQLLFVGHRNAEDILGGTHERRDHVGCFRWHLPTIGTVDLVAIVLLRVVTGGNHDAHRRVQMANSERQFGGWP